MIVWIWISREGRCGGDDVVAEMTRGGDTWRQHVEVTRGVWWTRLRSEDLRKCLGRGIFQKIHPPNTSFAHAKIPSKKPFFMTHIPHFGTNLPHQNKEYVRCDSRSMWHLVHFERRGIRGKYSISMEFQNFHRSRYYRIIRSE
jgi:hypothetical protein